MRPFEVVSTGLYCWTHAWRKLSFSSESKPALVEVERRFEEWSDFKVTRNEWGTMPLTPQRLVMVGPAAVKTAFREALVVKVPGCGGVGLGDGGDGEGGGGGDGEGGGGDGEGGGGEGLGGGGDGDGGGGEGGGVLGEHRG